MVSALSQAVEVATHTCSRGWCTTATTVIPMSLILRSNCTMLAAVEESSPEVGSSAKTAIGAAASSKPMLTRLRWPPDMIGFSASPA